MKFIKILTLILVIIVSLTTSCNKEKLNNVGKINKRYFITKDDARYIAERFNFCRNNTNYRITTNRTIKEIIPINDENNIASYYLINYNDNAGFLILSADYRQEAVLGFNEVGNFSLSNTPIQLEEIIQEEVNEINYLRENSIDSIEQHIEDTWAMLTQPPSTPIPTDPDACSNYTYIYKGPLLSTTWSQGCGYNDLCPIAGSGCCSCGHFYTGCVATAMAQIMNYHKWPTSYNWTLMANTYGTSECAKLMRNAGLSVSMSYGCNASGAYSEDVAPALKNIFGYASSTACLSYGGNTTYMTVQSELNNNRPVYLSGSGNAGGHAWVCDGYIDGESPCNSILFFYMNWGWGGSSNGSYAFNNWNPSGYTFNNSRKAIIIRKI